MLGVSEVDCGRWMYPGEKVTSFYSRDGITIHIGDCLSVLPGITDQVAMILTDLPFGTTACAWDSIIPLPHLWQQYDRLTTGAVISFSVEPFTSRLVGSRLDIYRYKFIWVKNGVTRFLDSAHRPLLDYEELPVFYQSQPTYNPQMWHGRPNHTRRTTVGQVGSAKIYKNHVNLTQDTSGVKYPRLTLFFDKVPPAHILHPSQKPVPLLRYLIRTYTNPGDVVLDNAMGVGSTLVAAQAEGRQAIGIEQNEGYCRAAIGRLSSPTLWSYRE